MRRLWKSARDTVRELKARVGAFLLQRASLKQNGLFDRLCARVLAWVTNSSNTQPNHYMRDELIDADIEFDPKELDRYQQLSKEQGACPADHVIDS